MFKIITALTMSVIGLLANAQTTETRDVSPFNKIEITDGVEVIYTQSDHFSLRAETSDALGLSTLLTESKDNTLKITCNGNLCETAKVYLSAPEIVSVKAHRNSKMTVSDRMHTSKLSVVLASGSIFNGVVKSEGPTNLKGKSGSIFNIRVETTSLDGSFQSGAKVNLSGNSEKTVLRTSDNALCNARNFIAGKVSVKSIGNSSVLISAENEIAVEVSDEATVRYFGMPGKVSVNPEAVATAERLSHGTLVTEN
jgi:hypothetical protein